MLLFDLCFGGAIFGYYAYSSTNNKLSQVDGNQLTHLLYGFAYLNGDGSITPGFQQYDIDTAINTKFNCNCGASCLNGVYGEIFSFKKKYPHVKTLISIGGWTWSTYFSQVFASSQKRATMIQSVTTFITKYGFDGIDIDYEFPEVTWREPGFTHSPNDYQNMLQFCKELRQYWTQHSISGLLTLAMQAQGAPHFNSRVSQYDLYVDFYLVMTYEYQHNSKVARHHSNLNVLANDPKDFSPNVKSGLSQYQFTTPGKVIIGIPAYTDVFKINGNRKNLNNIKGLGSPATLQPDLHWTYKTIREQDLFVEWDQNRGACSYFDDANNNFHAFDCVNSVKQKVQYMNSKKFGGMFIWELGQDSLVKWSLLKTMSENIPITKTPRSVCVKNSQYCNLKC